MIRMQWFLVLLITVLLPNVALAEERIALIIGNAAYRDVDRLDNPVQDAKLVADALRSTGFKVTTVLDADLKGFEDGLNAFIEQLDAAGDEAVGLFYFAGHGVQQNGLNWLIPVDAKIEQAASLRYETVSAQEVLDRMAEARNPTDIVVLDACRNNPYRGRFSVSGTRAVTRGMAEMSAPEGAFLIYSTAPGAVAYDGTGDASPFASAFAKGIAKPGVSIGDMMVDVRRDVRDATRALGTPQVPWTASSLLGQFAFVPRGRLPDRALDPMLPPPISAPPTALEGGLAPCSDQVRRRRRGGALLGGLGLLAGGGVAVGLAAATGGDGLDPADVVVIAGGGVIGAVSAGVLVGNTAVKPKHCAW